MFTVLPDFTPRDSHSLWYTSSRNPVPCAASRHAHHADASAHGSATNAGGHGSHPSRSRGHHVVERSALARLAADEECLNQRWTNVQDFGSAWLKPPGVPKTLHQMREEKREQEEHQEALRREQLAQELAEAEAGGMPDDGMMDDVQLDGAQDLDDEIPDADDPFDMDDDDDDDDDDDEENEEGDGEAAADETDIDDAALREERQNDLMAARMRMTDDAFREALVRGDADGDDMYGGDEELEQESQGQMLDEDDFVHGLDADDDDATGLDMDANLDDDIPEAGSGGGYEHTDSEADLSSSSHDDDDDDGNGEEEGAEERGRGAYDSSSSDDGHDDEDDVTGHDVGFAPRTAPLGPPQSPTTMVGRTSASGPRSSMDLSNLVSHDGDESSFAESSPAQSRRARYG